MKGTGARGKWESDEEMGKTERQMGKKTAMSQVKPSQTEQCASNLCALNLNSVSLQPLCWCCVNLRLTCPSSLSA